MKRLLLVLVAAALIAGGAVWLGWAGPGPAPRPVAVTIAPGATLTGAATALEKAGAIGSARRFLLLARLFGGSGAIQAGEYRIPARASGRDVLRLLRSGRVTRLMVTIPEGMPSVLVAERLAAIPELTGPAPVPPEGSVLPDSYAYRRGEARTAVIARMQAAMDATLARLWAGRSARTPVSSPEEAIILASIVEKETGVAAERTTVAGVYANRLKVGMPLQADPTVIYPVTRGRPLGRRILRSELRAKNGYNTYAAPGLPVGPIANPGRDSIAAVLDPAPTDALYFVADGRGGHVFAATLAEHNANVRRWYAIRRARGEM